MTIGASRTGRITMTNDSKKRVLRGPEAVRKFMRSYDYYDPVYNPTGGKAYPDGAKDDE